MTPTTRPPFSRVAVSPVVFEEMSACVLRVWHRHGAEVKRQATFVTNKGRGSIPPARNRAAAEIRDAELFRVTGVTNVRSSSSTPAPNRSTCKVIKVKDA